MTTLKFFKKRTGNLFKPTAQLFGETMKQITWDELLKGVFITGQIGSGKTSAPPTKLLNGILGDGSKPGGLFLCKSQNERLRIEKAIRAAGRADDMVINGPTTSK